MMIVYLILILATCVLSSSAFWNSWAVLEIINFILLPYLISSEKKILKEKIFMYFMTQFMASVVLLLSSSSFLGGYSECFMFFGLSIKMACFPFHTWFMDILPRFSWEKILVLTTLTKVAPIGLLMLLDPPKWFVWVLMIGLFASLPGASSSSLRAVLAYSALSHSSWMLICSCISKSILAAYIACYFAVLIPLFILLIKQASISMKLALSVKEQQSCLMIIILALSGVPPMLGFIPKLMVIQALVESGALLEAGVLGILSVIPVYFYLKTGLLSLGMKAYTDIMFFSTWNAVVTSVVIVSVFVLLILM